MQTSRRSKALLQKLPVRRLVKLPASYTTRMFITVFTLVRHLSPFEPSTEPSIPFPEDSL